MGLTKPLFMIVQLLRLTKERVREGNFQEIILHLKGCNIILSPLLERKVFTKNKVLEK